LGDGGGPAPPIYGVYFRDSGSHGETNHWLEPLGSPDGVGSRIPIPPENHNYKCICRTAEEAKIMFGIALRKHIVFHLENVAQTIVSSLLDGLEGRLLVEAEKVLKNSLEV
jgi:hypothetical protein